MSSNDDRNQAASWAQRLRARERGEMPLSREFGSTLALIGAIALLSVFAQTCWTALSDLANQQWTWTGVRQTAPQDWLPRIVTTVGRPLLLIIGGIFLLTFAVGWLQAGCGYYGSRLQFDLGRLNPVRHWRETNSLGRLANSSLGLARWLAMWVVVLACIWSARDSLLAISVAPNDQWLASISTVTFSVAIKVAAGLALLGLVDYAIQWRWFERRISMSPEEVRQDLRTHQIDPYVAGRQRSLGESFIENGLIRSVRASDVLLSDETGAVIGLARSDRDPLRPRIVLRAGAVHADATKNIAARFGIPIRNHSVASALFARCRVDDSLPSEFVATIQALTDSASPSEEKI